MQKQLQDPWLTLIHIDGAPSPACMEIMSCCFPGSFPPRIPRFLKPEPEDCWFIRRDYLPARGLPGGVRGGGNPRPPCHSYRGIPAPRLCHSRKGVPAPRINQREGIPAHPGGSADPQRCVEPTPRSSACWPRAGDAAGLLLQAPTAPQAEPKVPGIEPHTACCKPRRCSSAPARRPRWW